MRLPTDPPHHFRLAIFDLDGTVLTPEKTITPRFLHALGLLRQQQTLIALASGRSLASVRDIMTQLHLLHTPAFAIACNGAQLWSEQQQRLIACQYLQAEDIADLRQMGVSLGVPCYAQYPHGLASDRPIPPEAAVRRFSRLPVTTQTVSTTPKMMFIEEAEDIDALVHRIPPQYSRRYHMVRSEPNYYEVMKKGVHKGAACQQLARHINIPASDIFAIGDEQNDIEMLEFAGLGVAMGNASPAVKQQANKITESNSHDGAALAIENYLLHHN